MAKGHCGQRQRRGLQETGCVAHLALSGAVGCPSPSPAGGLGACPNRRRHLRAQGWEGVACSRGPARRRGVPLAGALDAKWLGGDRDGLLQVMFCRGLLGGCGWVAKASGRKAGAPIGTRSRLSLRPAAPGLRRLLTRYYLRTA